MLTATPETGLGVAGVLVLCWVYWPTFTELAHRWHADAQYSHGYLVPLFAGYLLWARRGLLAPGLLRPRWHGLLFLGAGLGMHFAGTYAYLDWLSAAGLLPCLAGLCLLGGGWRALHWAGPAIAFLIFMAPLPHRLAVGLAYPLQRIATLASTYALQTLGFGAFSEGTVIRMGEVRIGVVEACSGLSMLVIFFALTAAVTLLLRRPWYEKLLLFLSALPIALLSNIIRITVTGILHKTVGSELADYVFHNLAGLLMMPLALGLVWIELRLLGCVLVPCAAGQRDVPAVARLTKGAPPEPAVKRRPARTRSRYDPILRSFAQPAPARRNESKVTSGGGR